MHTIAFPLLVPRRNHLVTVMPARRFDGHTAHSWAHARTPTRRPSLSFERPRAHPFLSGANAFSSASDAAHIRSQARDARDLEATPQRRGVPGFSVLVSALERNSSSEDPSRARHCLPESHARHTPASIAAKGILVPSARAATATAPASCVDDWADQAQ